MKKVGDVFGVDIFVDEELSKGSFKMVYFDTPLVDTEEDFIAPEVLNNINHKMMGVLNLDLDNMKIELSDGVKYFLVPSSATPEINEDDYVPVIHDPELIKKEWIPIEALITDKIIAETRKISFKELFSSKSYRKDVREHCLNKSKIKELIENLLIEYQEEATSKWSSEGEKLMSSAQIDTLNRLFKELDL